MADQKRTFWDDLIEVGREILEKMDDALSPDNKKKHQPARVPVPVRISRDPYDEQ